MQPFGHGPQAPIGQVEIRRQSTRLASIIRRHGRAPCLPRPLAQASDLPAPPSRSRCLKSPKLDGCLPLALGCASRARADHGTLRSTHGHLAAKAPHKRHSVRYNQHCSCSCLSFSVDADDP